LSHPLKPNANMTEPSRNDYVHLTGGRLLAKNTLWNLLGTVAPLLVAVPAVPRLIHAMGTDRFGVLTLAWVVIGYFSLFDFGFGRALTKLVAEKLGNGRNGDIPDLFWTSLALMLVFSCVGGAVMAAVSPWMVHEVLRIPLAIQAETLRAFYVLAASVPVVIASTALRGFLEAHQRFGVSTAVRVPLGAFTFAGPFLVLPFSANLLPIVGILAAARLAACAVLWAFCLGVHPGLVKDIAVRWNSASSLFRFGGWMTVSNTVGPLIVYVDRFLIGALVSMSAVAYYATPSEVVSRLLIVPSAIVGVLFPAFSTGFAQDLARTRVLFVRGLKYTFLALFPCVLVMIVFAREGLTWWVGTEFAQHGTLVLQCLAIGVFFNGLAYVPFALVQGAGRPDLTGKLHLMELPAYTSLLWLMVREYGIEGAAVAWSLRTFFDALALFGMARRLLPTPGSLRQGAVLLPAFSFVTLVIAALVQGLLIKTAFLLVVILGFCATTWFFLLSPEERNLAQQYL
jgi:O-antigen/teichoic acid export membrane protein